MKTTVPVAVPARQRFGRFGTRAFRNGAWLWLLALLTLPVVSRAQTNTLSVNDQTANPGQTVNYTLQISFGSNTNNVTASVTLSGTAFAGITVSNISDGGSYSGGVVSYPADDFRGINRTQTRTFSVTFASPLNAATQLLAQGSSKVGSAAAVASNNITVTINNITPQAQAQTTSLARNAARTQLPALSGTDANGTSGNGTITTFRFVVPTTSLGAFYTQASGGTALVAGSTQTISLANAGNLYFQPNNSGTGTISTTYTAVDNGSPALTSAAASFDVVLIEASLAPLTQADALTLSYKASATVINILDNDAPAGSLSYNAIDITSVQISSTTGSNGGTFALNAATGVVTFTPPATISGTSIVTSITYTVANSATPAQRSAATTITVTVTNTAPVANNDAAALSFLSTSTINVLSNDTDADGNATIDATTVDLIPGTAAVDRTYTDANGVVFTVSATTGLISFSNPNSFVGTTSVSYRVKDNTGLVSNTATLTLTLTNADPTAVDGVNVAIVNTAGATVLNPSLKGFDGDGNLSYFSITGGLPTAAQGTLRYNGAVVTTSTQISAAQLNLLTFAPASGYVGRVVLSFQAVDSKGQTSAATTYTIPVGAANTITGFVYEDVNYGGGIGRSQAAIGGVGRGSATVELYNSSGTYINSATTAPDGSYSFANPGAGTYTVRVVSSTVSSSRAGYVNTLRPVQTYANGNNQRVGGEAPEKADALARTNQTLAGLNDNSVTPNLTAQSVASVTLAANGAAAADFGFSFDVVVNTNNTGQGSLAQFIANANALANTTAVLDQRPFMNALGATLGTDFPAGQETSIFMIADGTDKPGLRPGLTNQLRNAAGTAATTNSRALIVLTTALPSITGTNSTGTAIDGTTQTTLNDSNPIQLGAGGTVGVDAVTLSQVNGPEVEIASALTGYVLQFNSSNGILRGVAAHGGSGTSGTGSGTVGITGGSATTDMLIEQNLIGTTAFVLARPTAQPGAYMGIWLLNATGTVRNNIIAYNGNSGLNYSSAGLNGGGYTISGNEFTENGATVAGGDAISVGDQATIAAPAGPLLIENNLIRLSNSSGVQFDIGRVSDNVVRNNTIRDNGEGGLASSRLEGSGIHYLNRRSNPNPASSNSDLIERNIITSNQSSGIVINHNQNKVRITRNSIYENGSRTDTDARGLLSIDFTTGPNDGVGGNANYGQGDGVTPNDGVFNTDPNNGQANGGIDYPVITNISKTSTGKLRVQGYIGINPAGNTLFGGATVEIYSANNGDTNQNGPTTTTSGDNVAHGEAQTYIGTLVAAANGTFDVTLNSVSANINPGDNITATAWLANYGTSEAGTNQVSNFVVLPVELTAFEARAVQADAHLTWATAQEKNNARFVVERAAADGRFEAVGEVQGQGTSSTPRAYQFTDAGAARFGQQLFYRLRQVDFDGTSSYSPVRTATFGPLAARVQLYPNPALGYSVLDLRALPTGSYHVTIADVQGRLQSRQQLTGGAEHRLNVAALRAGVYLVSVRGEAGSWTARLVVQE